MIPQENEALLYVDLDQATMPRDEILGIVRGLGYQPQLIATENILMLLRSTAMCAPAEFLRLIKAIPGEFAVRAAYRPPKLAA